MFDHYKGDESSASCLHRDMVTRAKSELAEDRTKQSNCDKRFILLILLIMFLVIAQIIVLFGSSVVNVYANDADVSLEDIEAVNQDLKEMMKSINEINTQPQPEKNIEVGEKVAPVKAVSAASTKDKPGKNKTATLVPIVVDKKKVTTSQAATTEATELSSGYVKLDNKGKSLTDETEQWTCVYDTKTGLMWEVKSQEDAMRNSNNLYSWYDPKNRTLPGESDGGRCKGGTDCDTNAYVQAMNERNYCGHNDWRLPSREQMQTLVDLSTDKSKVKINKQYFPLTMPSWYWTSSDEDNADELAWYVLFRNGFALSDLKERPKHIRLVRVNKVN